MSLREMRKIGVRTSLKKTKTRLCRKIFKKCTGPFILKKDPHKQYFKNDFIRKMNKLCIQTFGHKYWCVCDDWCLENENYHWIPDDWEKKNAYPKRVYKFKKLDYGYSKEKLEFLLQTESFIPIAIADSCELETFFTYHIVFLDDKKYPIKIRPFEYLEETEKYSSYAPLDILDKWIYYQLKKMEILAANKFPFYEDLCLDVLAIENASSYNDSIEIRREKESFLKQLRCTMRLKDHTHIPVSYNREKESIQIDNNPYWGNRVRTRVYICRQMRSQTYQYAVTEKKNNAEIWACEHFNYMPGYRRIYMNVYIPERNGSFQEIDVLCVSEYGVFVLEAKEKEGKVIISNWTDKYWKLKASRGNDVNTLYSPVLQNQTHIEALQYLLRKVITDIPFYNFILFSYNSAFAISEPTIKTDYDTIISASEVYKGKVEDYSHLQARLQTLDKTNEKVLSIEQVDKIADFLHPYATIPIEKQVQLQGDRQDFLNSKQKEIYEEQYYRRENSDGTCALLRSNIFYTQKYVSKYGTWIYAEPCTSDDIVISTPVEIKEAAFNRQYHGAYIL